MFYKKNDNNAIQSRLAPLQFPQPKKEKLHQHALNFIRHHKLSNEIHELYDHEDLHYKRKQECENEIRGLTNFREIDQICETLVFKWFVEVEL